MGYPVGRILGRRDTLYSMNFCEILFEFQFISSSGNDRGDDGGGAADAGRAGAGEEEVRPEGRQGQVHLEEAMTDLQ